MPPINRKSAPRVVAGAVKKKNNWGLSEDYYVAPRRDEVVIDRQRPGDGFRHVLTKSDVKKFLEILPDWDELAIGLNAIVLAPGKRDRYGLYTPGVVHVRAWPDLLWDAFSPEFYLENRDLFSVIGAESEPLEDYLNRVGFNNLPPRFLTYRADCVLVKFDENAVRAFLLMGTLLHELGHHHDLMSTRSKCDPSRGERYAEEYERVYRRRIWEAYLKVFRLD